jgi:hypothetical protein
LLPKEKKKKYNKGGLALAYQKFGHRVIYDAASRKKKKCKDIKYNSQQSLELGKC